jgi:hypothetical protein
VAACCYKETQKWSHFAVLQLLQASINLQWPCPPPPRHPSQGSDHSIQQLQSLRIMLRHTQFPFSPMQYRGAGARGAGREDKVNKSERYLIMYIQKAIFYWYTVGILLKCFLDHRLRGLVLLDYSNFKLCVFSSPARKSLYIFLSICINIVWSPFSLVFYLGLWLKQLL